MKKQFFLTKEGKLELENELKTLIERRSVIAEEIAIARSQGDLAENAEYHAAKDDQGRNESRIEEVEHILKNAALITNGKSNGAVKLGSTVKLKSENGKLKEFQVVGTVEADPLNGKISDESPIGQALMGKKVGEEVEIKDSCFKITSIS
jgi:transcription elongation factor GreA